MSETVHAGSTVRDFDFWRGRWSVRNGRLRERFLDPETEGGAR